MNIVKKSNFEISEAAIQRILLSYNKIIDKYPVIMPNCYTQSDNEADVFMVRKSMLCDEFEIKISRDDFIRDRSKIIQYREIDRQKDLFKGDEYERWVSNGRIKGEEPWKMNKLEAYGKGLCIPNYFWYVLCEGILKDESEVPEYAGIVFVSKYGGLRIARNAKMLHRKKIDDDLYIKTIKKGMYRYLNGIRGW